MGDDECYRSTAHEAQGMIKAARYTMSINQSKEEIYSWQQNRSKVQIQMDTHNRVIMFYCSPFQTCLNTTMCAECGTAV